MVRRLIIARVPPSAVEPPIAGRERAGRAQTTAEYAGYWLELRSQVFDTLEPICEGDSMHGVHVFHDGLLVGGRAALKIAAEMAAQGNRSYRLALELVERGATLQQTEDAALLEERNALLRQALAAPRVENRVQARKRYEAQAQGLMAARDAYIAAQVDRLVGAEEAAVLFIGPGHLIEQVIAPDFGVTMLPSAPGEPA